MSTPLPQRPSPSSITATQLNRILSLYPSTLEAVYKRNSRLKDPKKLAQAIKDDTWRYEELPRIVAGRRGEKQGDSADGSKGAWLEKAELEKLVGWKM
jgi:hypothetical protein